MANPDLLDNQFPSLHSNPAARLVDSPANSHPLDNPIWNSLLTEHSPLAVSNHLARRYPAAIGPLGGFPRQSEENYEALRSLAGPGGVVVLFCTEAPSPPSSWTVIRGGLLTQMVREERRRTEIELTRGEEFRPLTAADVPAMLELAKLTEPGPFRERTIELGAFFGIFEAGRLVAMAGERLHLPHHVEVSAVCSHPDVRGRGYARLLIGTVLDEIERRGKIPFLHSYAHNHSAIRVYESLGFRPRRTFELAVLKNRE
jgi:GNAT superfamily N-acetyltransferase